MTIYDPLTLTLPIKPPKKNIKCDIAEKQYQNSITSICLVFLKILPISHCLGKKTIKGQAGAAPKKMNVDKEILLVGF